MKYEMNCSLFEEDFVNKQNIDYIINHGENTEIDLFEFSNVYSLDEINEDIKRLNVAERKIKKAKEELSPRDKEVAENNEKRGAALVRLLLYCIQYQGWFGESAIPSETSRFDDVINCVDLVVEYDQRGEKNRKSDTEILGISADATTTSSITQIEKKILRNIKKIKNGPPYGEIKYFQSQIPDENGDYFKGKINNLVPIVVGIDRQNADRLFDIYSEIIALGMSKYDDSKQRRRQLLEKLSRHPIQKIFFEEMRVQLELYKSIISENSGSIEQIQDLLEIINGAEKERENIGFSSLEFAEDDITLNNIKKVSQMYLPPTKKV